MLQCQSFEHQVHFALKVCDLFLCEQISKLFVRTEYDLPHTDVNAGDQSLARLLINECETESKHCWLAVSHGLRTQSCLSFNASNGLALWIRKLGTIAYMQINLAVGDIEILSSINLLGHLAKSAAIEFLPSVKTMGVPSGKCEGLSGLGRRRER